MEIRKKHTPKPPEPAAESEPEWSDAHVAVPAPLEPQRPSIDAHIVRHFLLTVPKDLATILNPAQYQAYLSSRARLEGALLEVAE